MAKIIPFPSPRRDDHNPGIDRPQETPRKPTAMDALLKLATEVGNRVDCDEPKLVDPNERRDKQN